MPQVMHVSMLMKIRLMYMVLCGREGIHIIYACSSDLSFFCQIVKHLRYSYDRDKLSSYYSIIELHVYLLKVLKLE